MARLFNLKVLDATLVGGVLSPLYSDPSLDATLATADKFYVHVFVDGTTVASTDVTVDVQRSNDGVTWETSGTTTVVSVATPGNGPKTGFGEWEWPAAFNRFVVYANNDNVKVRVIVCGRSNG